jgi:5'-nucleotidase
MPRILVTNDDGIQAPGLLALKKGLEPLGEVVVVAPERNWSASSHSKTMHKPLRVYHVTLPDGSAAYTTSGSPTDCVALALGGVLGMTFDLVVSGINSGLNIGEDVTYSGTVACAMEAVIKGVPGIAVSTCAPGEAAADMAVVRAAAATVAHRVAGAALAQGLPPFTLLNVNVPGCTSAEIQGLRITRMGRRLYGGNEITARHDPGGKPYYWLGGSLPEDGDDLATDVGAVKHGYISVTPISLDMTDYDFMPKLAAWELAAEAR